MNFGNPQQLDDLSNIRSVQGSSGIGVDTLLNVKDFRAGGTSGFRVNNTGVFAGGTSVLTSPFTVSYSGALNCTGADIAGIINATGGYISGNLSLTGTLFSDNGAGFQTELVPGQISFLRSGTQLAYIQTASGSNGLQLSSGNNIFFTTLTGANLITIDSSGNLHFASAASITFPSGRTISDGGSNVAINGDLKIIGGFYANGNGGLTQSMKDSAGNKICDITGGIITKTYY